MSEREAPANRIVSLALVIEVSESRTRGNPAECRELFCMCLLHPGCAFTVNAHHKTVTQLSKDGQMREIGTHKKFLSQQLLVFKTVLKHF